MSNAVATLSNYFLILVNAGILCTILHNFRQFSCDDPFIGNYNIISGDYPSNDFVRWALAVVILEILLVLGLVSYIAKRGLPQGIMNVVFSFILLTVIGIFVVVGSKRYQDLVESCRVHNNPDEQKIKISKGFIAGGVLSILISGGFSALMAYKS